MNNRVEVPGCVSRRAASKGGTRRDSRTPASGRFGARTRVAFQRVLIGAVLVSAGAALAQYENPSWLTDRQRERHGIPIPGAESAQEALPEVPQCSDTTAAESEPLADALSRWADALQAGLAVDDGGQVLESVYWPEQLALLRRAAVVVGTEERIDAMGSAHDPESSETEPAPTLAGLLGEPSTCEQLLAFTTDAQTVAAEIMRQCPGAQAEHVRVVAQEFARLRVVEPSHPAVRQRYRFLTILCRESKCSPTAMGRDGDAGLFQFIPSTCRWLGLDYAKMHSARTEDIRYQCRAGFRLLGMKPGGYWSQWHADLGRDGRDGETG